MNNNKTNPLVAGFIHRIQRDLVDPDFNRRRVSELMEMRNESSSENDASILHGAMSIKNDYENSLLSLSVKKESIK